MNVLKVAVLGYGSAGRAFGKLLIDKMEEIKGRYNTEIIIVVICTKSRGCLIYEQGIDLTKVEQELASTGKFKEGIDLESMEVIKFADYDVLIEMTPLNIFTGQPATDHIKEALLRGKHVISANKGPIAWAFDELCSLAEKNNCLFYYETTVMDGAPVFNLTADTLKMCQVTEINGILNSTTNFILEELGKGVPYDEVISEGKRRGFVEADPSMDVEGWDAAAKVTALLNVLMQAGITPMDIDRKGIEDVTYEQIQDAQERGKVIKLLCRGTMENGTVKGSVKPVELEKDDLLASISGTSSVVSITTDLMGTISIVEHDPEIEQTAYGIFSDLIRVLDHM